jgi:hypothetical protein
MQMPFERNQNPWLPIGVLVEISGTDMQGQYFCTTEKTIAVSRHGAKLQLQQSLVPDQEITICRKNTPRQCDARVISQVGITEKGHLYAVELLGNKNIWGIHFPPPQEVANSDSVKLLCGKCSSVRTFELNEIEVLAVQVDNSISRHCDICNCVTGWKSAALATERLQERRRYSRKQMNLPASLRQPLPAIEESVTLLDLSRGGIRFQSRRQPLRASRRA